MTLLKVALLQLTSAGMDQQANLTKGEAFCRLARQMGADIALFPEMWNIGYTPCPKAADARREWLVSAVGPDDPFVTHFRALARELDMAIVLTTLERWRAQPRDSACLIDRHGQITLTYAKVHTCDFGFEIECTPGEDFYVCDLDTAQGSVKVGVMICYDREFPESARILMLKGAELILTPNACTLDAPRLMQFRTRAFENMLGVAMANYASPEQNGHSVAYDGVAFDENETALDPLIVEAGEAEGVYLAQFDLERLRAWRRKEVGGNAFRKPHAYSPLLTEEVHAPFIRPQARR
jgi:N-carbamoylputrescine amidase